MTKRISTLLEQEIIEKAWCDKTTFEDILALYGLDENKVKKILRKSLKRKSYIIWRERVNRIKMNKKIYSEPKKSLTS